MITFVDTNVLLDVFLPDPKWGMASKQALEKAFNSGKTSVINAVGDKTVLSPLHEARAKMAQANR